MRSLFKKRVRKSLAILTCAVMIVTSALTGNSLKVFGQDSTKVEINGFQISVTVEGFRTVYSVSGESTAVGLLYGFDNYVDASDMVVGSSNQYVYNFDATDTGKLTTSFSKMENAQSYAMTMKFVKNAAFYSQKMIVRAYAKLEDGSYVYSNSSTTSVYYIADYLYTRGLAGNKEAHEYLYTNILSVVNPDYAEIDYDWAGSLVPPSDTEEETTAAVEEAPTEAPQDDNPLTVIASEGGSYTYEKSDGMGIVTLDTAGDYYISGGTESEPAENVVVNVAKKLTEDVNITLDNVHIDNSALGTSEDQDNSVIAVGKSTTTVNITFEGDNVLKGNGSYTSEPAAVIGASDTSTTMVIAGTDNNDTLTVIDSMSETTDFTDVDPSDGIYCKGTLSLGKGTYIVESNGDTIKGTGKDGNGGVIIEDGTYTLTSRLSDGIKSKNGVVSVAGGTINIVYTKGDGINAKNYAANITGGTLNIDNCYGDGIQGESVYITGDDTVVNIKTYYEYAGKNFYNSELGTGNYNIFNSSETQDVETVYVDTGSHKGIKGGTKAESFSYDTVEDGSDYEAGVVYSVEASGGILITGGTITVDTTNAGIKYNGSSGGGMGGMGVSTSTSGNIAAANSDGQYIIGSPDDAIHSNNTCEILGGKIDIYSSDDGITGPQGLTITDEYGDTDITIHTAYEGIEGGVITIGTENDTTEGPKVKVYSNDDGINAAKKASVMNAYTDESEAQYVRTETASSGNVMYVYSGYVNVMIGDDETHSFTLPYSGQADTTGTYSSNGDGIDCNGSFYAYGGTVIVYGANSNDNAPVDVDNTYYIGSGATLLTVGSNGMMEVSPTVEQAYVKYSGSSSSSGPGGGMGGFPGSSSSSSGLSGAFGILNGSNVILSINPTKNYSVVFYTSPDLVKGTSYSVYNGGSVSGSLINSDSSAYDFRYTGYSTISATSLGSVTAN